VTILVSSLHICPFQTYLDFKNSCNFDSLDLALELLPTKVNMNPSDENLFEKLQEDIEVPAELTSEEKEFLKSLEKIAEGVEDEANNPQ
jgi:hypothetical protein